jgi:hypothetical protein
MDQICNFFLKKRIKNYMTKSVRHSPIRGFCSDSDKSWKKSNHISYRSHTRDILSKLFKNNFDDSNINFPNIKEISNVYTSNKEGKNYYGFEQYYDNLRNYKRMMRK